MVKKKRKVPEVLWRVYGPDARTLAETIIYFLPEPPPSAAECQCKGRHCLGCSGADAMSFLVRDSDPSEYKKLLIRCFAVVSENAPRLSVFYPDHRWSQREIVRRTIEMIMCDQQMSSNVIYNGYNKLTRSSDVVDTLTMSAWSLLLTRIGDDAMVYLLKYTSIFFPLEHNNLFQVVGIPMSFMASKISKHIAGSSYQQLLSVPPEHTKKRQRSDNEYTCLDIYSSADHPLGVSKPLRSATFDVGDNHRNCIREFNLQQQRTNSQANSSSIKVSNACHVINKDRRALDGKIGERSNDAITKLKKRTRPFSWQRRRKRQQMNFTEVLTTCISPKQTAEIVNRDIQQSSVISNNYLAKMVAVQELTQHTFNICPGKITGHCFCFLMLQAEQRITYREEINRKCMFYKSDSFSTLFPRNHILNILKPKDNGAASLVKDIFGLSVENLISMSSPCFQKYNCGSCLNESTCLYHLLLKLLKTLIRRARGCQYLKLLDKHCSTKTSIPAGGGESRSFIQDNEPSQNELLERNCTEFEKECVTQPKKSSFHDNRLHLKHCQRMACVHQYERNESYCPQNQVASFIWAACRSIVPLDFIGPPSNWRALRRNISRFLQLRRYEKFTLKQCMNGLKTSCIPLLCNEHCSCYLSNHSLVKGEDVHEGCNKFSESITNLKNKLFSCWVYWFFSCLVVPLVQSNFYVTESEVGRQEMFYYQKPIWEKLTSRAISSLREQNYCFLDNRSFRNIVRKRKFGFSKVRFCPKENGMRVLANLAAPSKVPFGHQSYCRKHFDQMQRRVEFDSFKSVNYVLRDLHAVLKGIKMEHPEMLGSSVFDYNDVYEKLCPFIIGLKNGSTTIPSVFVVICDVSKAFDSVDQDKLLNVMKEVMINDEYLIRRSPKVICRKSFSWVHPGCTLEQNISTAITKPKTYAPFQGSQFVKINQETTKKISKVELYNDLREHVKFNVLQLGQKFYLQEVGISQGSIVSSLLCSFYYGHLEKNVILPFLEKTSEHCIPELVKDDFLGQCIREYSDPTEGSVKDAFSTSSTHILLRFIDDFLFISTSKQQAVSFFTRLQRGFREYNCSINEAKSCMNFDMDHSSGNFSKRMYTGEDGIIFLPWSGLLINFCTLEIQADYTRYLDIHLSSTLTVCGQDKPSHRLKEKLLHYMRPKCHPIFFDSNINSAAIVRLNVYQAFLLCAMKFHCYVCDISSICSLDAEHYLNMIRTCVRYMHKLIKRQMYSKTFGSDIRPVLKLKKREVIWLGLNAFIRVLRRKKSKHFKLLLLLRSELLKDYIMQSASLKYAVDDSHSALFWKIKY